MNPVHTRVCERTSNHCHLWSLHFIGVQPQGGKSRCSTSCFSFRNEEPCLSKHMKQRGRSTLNRNTGTTFLFFYLKVTDTFGLAADHDCTWWLDFFILRTVSPYPFCKKMTEEKHFFCLWRGSSQIRLQHLGFFSIANPIMLINVSSLPCYCNKSKWQEPQNSAPPSQKHEAREFHPLWERPAPSESSHPGAWVL